MIDVEWHDHGSAEALAGAVARQVSGLIEAAVAVRGSALAAFPGGSSPRPIFERLVQGALPWDRLTILPGDDRFVSSDNALSNAALLARFFEPTGARLLSLVSDEADDYREAGRVAAAMLGELAWPLDLVWLGIGKDGHTASIFPGPDYAEALEEQTGRAIGLCPDPLPPEAPVPRVTLTAGAIQSARMLLLTISGDEKRKVLEQALKEGASSDFPVGRVLAGAAAQIHVHWAP